MANNRARNITFWRNSKSIDNEWLLCPHLRRYQEVSWVTGYNFRNIISTFSSFLIPLQTIMLYRGVFGKHSRMNPFFFCGTVLPNGRIKKMFSHIASLLTK